MAAYNYFGRANTLAEINDIYDSMTSPENLACDGMRSPREQQVVLKKIESDLKIRLKELDATPLPGLDRGYRPGDTF